MRSRLALSAAALLSLVGVTCAPQAPVSKSPGPGDPPPAQAVTDPVPSADRAHLQKRIDAVLKDVTERDLLTTHAFWTIFHGVLGMGPDTQLLDPATGKHIRAIDQIAQGKGIRGLEFVETRDGVDVVTQAGSGVGQGHQDQFIAEMAQWGMPLSQPFHVNGKDCTFDDFVRHAKMRASLTRDQELSWAIVIVSQYYGPDHHWTNQYGEKISLEDVARYERQQPIQNAACGGTHRLFGLTWAYHLHLKKGGKAAGVWKEVADEIDEYKAKARKFQNPDGSFSSDYVSSPGFTKDTERRIATTGHVLEWLGLAMTVDELKQPWVENAAGALTQMILDKRDTAIDGGSLYHAVHGLYIYRQRVFGVPGPRGLTIP
jgi:hypothetical protein